MIVVVAPVKAKSAQKLSRVRLSLFSLSGVIGQLVKDNENHLSSNFFNAPFSDNVNMACEKSAVNGEPFAKA